MRSGFLKAAPIFLTLFPALACCVPPPLAPSFREPRQRAGEKIRGVMSSMRRGRGAEAEAALQEALRVDPLNFVGLCLMTQFLRESGRLEESLAFADRLQGADLEGVSSENRPEKWLQRAETLMSLGSEVEAERDAQRALEEEPRSFPSLWLMARLRWKIDPAAAFSLADRMLEAAGPDRERAATAHTLRSEFRLAGGDLAGARADLESAVEAFPRSVVALAAMTRLLRAQGHPEEALAFADRLVKAARDLSPERRPLVRRDWDMLEAYLQRSQARFSLKRYRAAERDLRKALAIDGKNLEALRAMTRLFLETGRPAEALSFADRVVQATAGGARREGARGYSERARVFLALADPARAEAELGAALEADPRDHVALRAMMRLLQEGGRQREALGFAERVVDIFAGFGPSELARAKIEVAQILAALGDLEASVAQFEAALALDPGNAAAAEALAGLKQRRRNRGEEGRDP